MSQAVAFTISQSWPWCSQGAVKKRVLFSPNLVKTLLSNFLWIHSSNFCQTLSKISPTVKKQKYQSICNAWKVEVHNVQLIPKFET